MAASQRGASGQAIASAYVVGMKTEGAEEKAKTGVPERSNVMGRGEGLQTWRSRNSSWESSKREVWKAGMAAGAAASAVAGANAGAAAGAAAGPAAGAAAGPAAGAAADPAAGRMGGGREERKVGEDAADDAAVGRDEEGSPVADPSAGGVDLGTESADLVARYADLGAQSADLDARDADLVMLSADLVARNADLVARNADLVTRSADLDVRNADLVAGRSRSGRAEYRSGYLGAGGVDLGTGGVDLGTRGVDLGAGVADLSAGVADLSARRADLGAGRADLGAGRADLGTGRSDLGAGRADLGAGVADLDVRGAVPWRAAPYGARGEGGQRLKAEGAVYPTVAMVVSYYNGLIDSMESRLAKGPSATLEPMIVAALGHLKKYANITSNEYWIATFLDPSMKASWFDDAHWEKLHPETDRRVRPRPASGEVITLVRDRVAKY
ncbi:unnamed protein product [Closterium sp. NIES-53]